jgi:hypothetical protein
MAQPIRLPNAQEQQVLDHLTVRLGTGEERPRWNAEVTQHHYLHSATLVGEQLGYVAEYQGVWLALLGGSAPARHLRPRDAWIGWSKDQRVRSVNGVAVLGLLSRISLARFQDDCRRPQPVRDKTDPVWSGRLQKRPRGMRDRLLERCLPP